MKATTSSAACHRKSARVFARSLRRLKPRSWPARCRSPFMPALLRRRWISATCSRLRPGRGLSAAAIAGRKREPRLSDRVLTSLKPLVPSSRKRGDEIRPFATEKRLRTRRSGALVRRGGACASLSPRHRAAQIGAGAPLDCAPGEDRAGLSEPTAPRSSRMREEITARLHSIGEAPSGRAPRARR